MERTSVTAQGTENPVREAASLIVVAKNHRARCKSAKFNPREYSVDLNDVRPNDDVKTDYQLLMTKRSGKSSYLASAYVFPGGHADLADFASGSWSQLFEAAGLQQHLQQLIQHNQNLPKPRILAEPLLLQRAHMDSALAPEIGFRINAIRETFEETGVLIAIAAPFLQDFIFEYASSGNLYTNEYMNERNLNFIEDLCKRPEVDDWRHLIKKDANNFYKFCVKFQLVPNVFVLHEWWNWSTPVTLGHKLFDTILYVTFLQRRLTSTVDNSEVCQIEWLTPEEMLTEHLQAKAFIAPPQIYELSRLANFRQYEELKNFSMHREQFGIERWTYYVNGLADGALLALPGDDKYPQDGNLEQKSQDSLNTSLAEMRAVSTNLNRIELKVPVAIAHCNVPMPCGHVAPITFDSTRIAKL